MTPPPSGSANATRSQRQDHPQHQSTGAKRARRRRRDPGRKRDPDSRRGGALAARPPGFSEKAGFIASIATIILAALVLYIIFKRKDWL